MRIGELNENSFESYDEEDEQAGFDDIIRNCSIAVKLGGFLFRGMNSEYDQNVIIWPESNKHRPSANFHWDYYEHVLNHLPSWEGWPDRSKSIICSTDDNYASGYGYNYVVFPVDNAVLGVTSGQDFWDSTINQTTRLRSFGAFGHTFPSFVRNLVNISDTTTPETIISDAERLGILGDIDDALSPQALGLTMASVQEVAGITRSREVWTSDTCYGIQEDTYYHKFQEYLMMKELKR